MTENIIDFRNVIPLSFIYYLHCNAFYYYHHNKLYYIRQLKYCNFISYKLYGYSTYFHQHYKMGLIDQ